MYESKPVSRAYTPAFNVLWLLIGIHDIWSGGEGKYDFYCVENVQTQYIHVEEKKT